MINEPLDVFFEKLVNQLSETVSNLDGANIEDVRFVKIERVVWITREGFYGYQPQRLPFGKDLDYLQGVNMFVFIDSKWCYVVFEGKWGYRYKLKDLNSIRMSFLKSWGEPRTLGLAQEYFDAQELDFTKSEEEMKIDDEARENMIPVKGEALIDHEKNISKQIEKSVNENEDEDSEEDADSIYKPDENGLDDEVFS